MTKQKKILCIGDSLALPGHLNKYEDTWIYLLKQKFFEFDFITFFRRQLTSDVLVTMGGGETGVDKWPKGADCLEAFNPDVVIIQLGIVDCAPRLMNVFDKLLLRFLKGKTSIAYIELVKKIRKRKTTNTVTPVEVFKKNWKNYLDRAANFNTSIIIMSISYPDTSFLKKNPDVILNIKKYNEVLMNLGSNYPFVKIIHPLDPQKIKEPIYQDGYHPNSFGHKLIFELINSSIL